MQQPGIDVEIGGDTYRVVAQRQGRLTRRLFGDKGIFASLEVFADLEQDASFDSLYELIGGRIYDVLAVFIPDFMPRWQFDGFASATAAEQGQYDEEADRSPTIPEITGALKAAITVNDLDWLGKLKDLVDPKLLRSRLNLAVARMGTGAPEAPESSPPSPSLPQANGESAPTSSGTSDPTPPTPPASASPLDDSESLRRATPGVGVPS